MKKGLTFVLYFLFSQGVFSQAADSPITHKWERDYQGIWEFNLHNTDYCDYYVVYNINRINIAKPGKNSLIRMTQGTAAHNQTTFPDNYLYYKGDFPHRMNVDFLYALPVKSGDSVIYTVDSGRRTLSHRFFSFYLSDTIYAAREGRVCLNNARGMAQYQIEAANIGEQILLYHKDNTFALYRGFSNVFVSPGSYVKVGQPIGIGMATLEGTMISVSFFFLDKNKLQGHSIEGNPHTYFNPVFSTANVGNVRLEEGTVYVAKLTDEIITQEMSNREKKRYEKRNRE